MFLPKEDEYEYLANLRPELLNLLQNEVETDVMQRVHRGRRTSLYTLPLLPLKNQRVTALGSLSASGRNLQSRAFTQSNGVLKASVVESSGSVKPSNIEYTALVKQSDIDQSVYNSTSLDPVVLKPQRAVSVPHAALLDIKPGHGVARSNTIQEKIKAGSVDMSNLEQSTIEHQRIQKLAASELDRQSMQKLPASELDRLSMLNKGDYSNRTSTAKDKHYSNRTSTAKDKSERQSIDPDEKGDPDYGDYIDPEAGKSLAQSNKLQNILNVEITTIPEEVPPSFTPNDEIDDGESVLVSTPIERFFNKVPILLYSSTSPFGAERSEDLGEKVVSALSVMIDRKSDNQNPFAAIYAGYVHIVLF